MVFGPVTGSAVLFSCALLGFRHGFDYDHIAAITDIAGLDGRRVGRTMRLGLSYAMGHAATVAVLGAGVIALGLALPAAMDRWAERLVGLTLIVLAGYVLVTLVRTRGRGAPVSRGALLVRLFRRGKRVEPVGGGACFGIGVIHGLGAETPSQLALFLLAANLGGASRGLLGLGCFLLGLLGMNTLMTACAAGMFRTGLRWEWWPATMAGITAAYSFGMGVVFLCGWSGMLRNIAG